MNNFFRTFSNPSLWQDGKYIDLWSLVHLELGLIVGLGARFLSLDMEKGSALLLITIILWMLYGFLRGVTDSTQNRAIDVFVTFVGFIITFTFFDIIASWLALTLFALLTLDFFIANLLGFKARRRSDDRAV